MSRLQLFRARRVTTSIAQEQPQRKTQNPCENIKPNRYQQPNLSVAPIPLLYLHSQLTKSKSVTDPVNEAAQSMLSGNFPTTDMATRCSGTSNDLDIDSESFADMIYGSAIVDQYTSHGECSPPNFSERRQVDAQGSNTAYFREQYFCKMLEGICSSKGSALELCLLRIAEKAVAMAKAKEVVNAAENAEQTSCFRRFVMKSLRLAGYNAAICKTRWERTTLHPAGDYEFIDVVIQRSKLKSERFFVDIDFREQFEIARPTDEYSAVLQKLPTLFVGRADKLFRIINIMCDLARRSLKERGICLPPWRKYGYMEFKWAGPYSRTTNPSAPMAAQGTSSENGVLPQFPFSGIALKGTRWGATVVPQVENVNEASHKNVWEKLNYADDGNKQLESPDRLLTKVEQYGHVKKIAALATALAKAGLCPPPLVQSKPNTFIL